MAYTIRAVESRTKSAGGKRKKRWRATVSAGWISETKRYASVVNRTFGLKRQAELWALRKEAELDPETQVRPGKIRSKTLRQLVAHHALTHPICPSIAKSINTADCADKTCRSLDTFDGENYLTKLSQSGKAPNTIRNHMHALKAVINTGIKDSWLEFDPFATVQLPVAAPSRDRLPSDTEIALLAQASGYSAHTGPVRDSREAAVCAFCISCITALRLNEIVQARVSWITVEQDMSILKIPATVAKNRTSRSIPLTAEALTHFARCNITDAGRFFGYSTKCIGKRFSDVRDAAGIPGRYHPDGIVFHDSRHRAITDLLTYLRPDEVRYLVGHASLDQIVTYAQSNPVLIGQRMTAAGQGTAETQLSLPI